MDYSVSTSEKLLETCIKHNKKIYEIMQEKEAFDSETSVETVRKKVLKIIREMQSAIKRGLNSEEEAIGGLCGKDCAKLKRGFKENGALFGDVFEKITLYALATTEENMRMNKIAACPTAGACGIVPAVIEALAEKLGKDDEERINALITAGMTGYIISSKAALAGAVAGCQAECGSAAAMSASAAVYLLGGDNEKIINAAALALKNILGLTCDTVAGLVAIPCVKRNAFMAIHAVTAAEMAFRGIESKIPFDEVIDAMAQTGLLMSPLLKETSQGGLSSTKTGINIMERLQKIFTENN